MTGGSDSSRSPAEKGSRLGLLWRRLRGGRLTRRRAAGSVAAGLFVGSLPVYGLHFPLCVALCVPLKLDVLTAYVAANVSNPLFAPFLITAEVQLGALLLHGHFIPFDVEQAKAVGLGSFVLQGAVGSVLLGAALATLGAVTTLAVSRREERALDERVETAITRTLQRYASAPPPDRVYVRMKLRTDPVVEQLAGLDGAFGDVVDLAAGRGQIGLFLLELGQAESLSGVDWDERKMEVARRAAGESARMSAADVRTAPLPDADTILMVDVLHYLKHDEQDALLARASQALRAGGRLIVREVDPHRGLGSRLAIWGERLATRTRYNRGERLEFRSPEEIAKKLTELGLEARVERLPGSPLSNALILATRPPPSESTKPAESR